MERYSEGKAREEADRMKDLIVPGDTAEAYTEAEEMAERELAEYYQDFNEAFFYEGGDVANASREEIAGRYKKILQGESLQDVLAGKALPEDLPQGIGRELEELIRHEILHSRYIQKNWKAQSLEPLLKEFKIQSAPTSDQRSYISARTIEHLYRLALPDTYYPNRDWRREIPDDIPIRNSVSVTFAKDFLEFVSQMEKADVDDGRCISEIISGEGSDTMTFWTLSPYVADELRREGLSGENAMAKIFEWVRVAYRNGSRNGQYNQASNLEGLYSNVGYYRQNYVLGIDERMPSHLLSRLYAKEVIKKFSPDSV